MNDLVLYYQLKKPNSMDEREMEDIVQNVFSIFNNYGFVKLTYPFIKNRYGVFCSRHYDGYVFRVRFLSQYHLTMFKLTHVRYYCSMTSTTPNIVDKDDFL